MSTSAVRLSKDLMTLIDDIETLPLRRNRRHDMVVAYWQQWITEGRVYRRGGSGRPRNTNDLEDRAIRRWPLRHQQRR
ncbi:hypothetical protein TNCV_3097511 [Trichonephila clavipes]|nr:hypothetical protein TNCV_3097511 [Trichonephila clavipes]